MTLRRSRCNSCGVTFYAVTFQDNCQKCGTTEKPSVEPGKSSGQKAILPTRKKANATKPKTN